MKTYITKKEKVAFALAAVAGYLAAGIAQSYLMSFITDILLLSTTFLTILMAIARVWDAINDPFMGVLIDKHQSKEGKMRPFVKIGAIVMTICCLLIFIPFDTTIVSKTFLMVWIAVIYLLFGMAYTLVDVPAMGLMSVATPNSKERAGLLSFYVTVGTIGGLMPLAFFPVFEWLFGTNGWQYFALAVFTSIVVFVGYFTLYRKSKERCATQTQNIKAKDMFKVAVKNKPMLQSLLMSMLAAPRYMILPALWYIATYVYVGLFGDGLTSGTVQLILNVIIGVGMFGGIFLTPVMYKKMGYRNTAFVSAIVGGVALCLAYVMWIIGQPYIALPCLTIGGLGLGAYNVLPYPMVGESLDYLEYKTGERMEGICFSMNSFVTKFNNAVGFIGFAVGLIIIGYIEPVVSGVALEQATSTVNGMFALITLVPGISFFVSLIPMFFYNFHGEKKDNILAELEQRRQASGKMMVVEDGSEAVVDMKDEG